MNSREDVVTGFTVEREPSGRKRLSGTVAASLSVERASEEEGETRMKLSQSLDQAMAMFVFLSGIIGVLGAFWALSLIELVLHVWRKYQ